VKFAKKSFSTATSQLHSQSLAPGAPLLAFEKWPAGSRNRALWRQHRGPPFGYPLGFAWGFGKTGQAFSKSVRSDAPQLVRPNDQRQPELDSPLLMWLTRLEDNLACQSGRACDVRTSPLKPKGGLSGPPALDSPLLMWPTRLEKIPTGRRLGNPTPSASLRAGSCAKGRARMGHPTYA